MGHTANQETIQGMIKACGGRISKQHAGKALGLWRRCEGKAAKFKGAVAKSLHLSDDDAAALTSFLDGPKAAPVPAATSKKSDDKKPADKKPGGS